MPPKTSCAAEWINRMPSPLKVELNAEMAKDDRSAERLTALDNEIKSLFFTEKYCFIMGERRLKSICTAIITTIDPPYRTAGQCLLSIKFCNDGDSELQQMINEFQMKRVELNAEMAKDDRSAERLTALD